MTRPDTLPKVLTEPKEFNGTSPLEDVFGGSENLPESLYPAPDSWAPGDDWVPGDNLIEGVALPPGRRAEVATPPLRQHIGSLARPCGAGPGFRLFYLSTAHAGRTPTQKCPSRPKPRRNGDQEPNASFDLRRLEFHPRMCSPSAPLLRRHPCADACSPPD